MKTVYVDNNATTKVAPEVLEEMLPYFSELYGNPSSMHFFGGQVQKKVNEAREKVADDANDLGIRDELLGDGRRDLGRSLVILRHLHEGMALKLTRIFKGKINTLRGVDAEGRVAAAHRAGEADLDGLAWLEDRLRGGSPGAASKQQRQDHQHHNG